MVILRSEPQSSGRMIARQALGRLIAKFSMRDTASRLINLAGMNLASGTGLSGADLLKRVEVFCSLRDGR